MKPSLLACLAIGHVVAVPALAHAGGFSVIEFGTRRTGMAAAIGRPDELAAAAHNPSGITMQSGTNVYLFGGLANISTEFDVVPWDQSQTYITDIQVGANGFYNDVKPKRAMAGIPMLAVSHEILPGKLWGALSLHVGNATGAAFGKDAVTRYHLIEGYIIAPQASAVVAYKPRPNWAIAAMGGVVNLRVEGSRYLFPELPGIGSIYSLVGSKTELQVTGSGWAPAWSVSTLYWPTPKLSLGATVVGRVDVTYQGDVTMVAGDDAPFPGDVVKGRQSTDFLIPWSFTGGANYDVHPNIEIGGEFRYWLYRQYKELYTKITGISLLRELRTEKNYNDSYQIAGGVRVHDLPALPCYDFMLGTHWDQTPAPAKTVTLDQPTFSHWGIHAGVRYRRGKLRFGASYTFYKYLIPDIRDSITLPPSNVSGNGINNIVSLQVEGHFGK